MVENINNVKKKKVAFCVDQIIMGGVEKILIEIFDGLLKTNKYEIVLFSHSYIEESYFLDYFKQNNIDVRYIALLEKKPKNLIKKIVWKIKKIFFKIKQKNSDVFAGFDIIIDFKNGFSRKLIENSKDKLKIMWIHGSTNYVKNNMDFDFNIYEKVVCLSDKLKDDLISLNKIDLSKIYKIYNPINIEKIIEKSNEPLEIDDKYFCCVTRLDTDKDLDTLINAYKLFFEETNSEIKLYIIGEGPEEKRLKKKVEDYKLSEKIIFKGKINNPYPYMKKSTATVLSSYSEGLPVTLVESLIVGTLAISSNCPSGPREILLDGKAGILFEPGNVNDLKNIFIKITNSQVDIKSISQNAQNSLYRFDVKNVIPQIEELLES